jgi:hypothetical protein
MDSSNNALLFSENFKKLIKDKVLRKNNKKVLHLSKAGIKNKLAKCIATEWCAEILDEDYGRYNMDSRIFGYLGIIFDFDESLVKEIYNNVPEGKPKHKTLEDFKDYLDKLYDELHQQIYNLHAMRHYNNYPEEYPGHLNGLRNI